MRRADPAGVPAMRLEDLCGRRVGDIVMFLDGAPWVPAAFHDHAQQAQWHTINSLIRLAGNSTDGVANERIAVVEWWRTIESLIALMHLIALEESHRGLRQEQPRLHTDHIQTGRRMRGDIIQLSSGSGEASQSRAIGCIVNP